MPDRKYISIKGAKLHNLKNISVDIPRNALTVVTGVSGSGKSTLAFDTIYAEGQRRFVESLSSYARQFLERMSKPDVDSITGLPPAIAIEQKPPSRNPRSTVGTSTEVYDYLRLLYGRIGTTICKECGKVVRKDSPASVVQEILNWGEGDKLLILFPVNSQSRSLSSEIDKFRELGFFRIVLENSDEIINLQDQDLPSNIQQGQVFVLADRMILQKDEDSITRLTDSIEAAFINGTGKIRIRNLSNNETSKFSSIFECADCDIVYMEPEPRLFAFNNPFGACPNCQGFGRTIGIDEDLVIPDKSRSLRNGAVHPFRTPGFSQHQRELLKIAGKHDLPLDAPYYSLTKEQQKLVWTGSGEYIGIDGFFSMLEENSYKMHYRILMSRYRGYTTCKACDGSRIRTSGRQVFVSGKNIPYLVKLPLGRLLDFIKNMEISENQRNIASQVIREIEWRLQLLVDIGLDYLSLDRLSHTLSGGEAQRINLSTALGSSLVGTLYVLDEPSIGMHPRDTQRLINILVKLRNLGNTIIVVEHDLDIIRFADYILDMGPFAGEFGGELIYAGTYENLKSEPASLTAQYISGRKKIEINPKRNPGNGKNITIINPHQHNLKIDSVSFPLGCMTVVTGVSGSGKSTLVHDILYQGMKKYRGGGEGSTGFFDRIDGSNNVEYIELVDQSPIGKSSRSTPATYTKAFDSIREVFAQTQLARQFGWKPGHFSFNVSGGRCEVCEGEGTVTVDMQFLPDVHLECEACKGTRYKKEVRNVLFKDKSIVDVLSMTIDEALVFFDGISKITRKLKIMQEVGLGYLKLGQPSTMLSGGESQRIKLANHLDSTISSPTLFIFDEPTTGLHIDDISKLIKCFNRLIDSGHSVVIIEHNIHVIASADWVIDLGPEAGESGGELIAAGTPEKVMKEKRSHTGKALKEFLNGSV